MHSEVRELFNEGLDVLSPVIRLAVVQAEKVFQEADVATRRGDPD